MIGRLQILLPYVLAIPAEGTLTPYEVKIGGYTARVHPPHRSKVNRAALDADSTEPLLNLPKQLDPVDPQPVAPMITVDDSPIVEADVLRIDFLKDEFDRSSGAEDPPTDLGFEVANGLIARLRTLGRAGHVKAVDSNSSVWQFEYLNDDESQLEQTEGFYRSRAGVGWRWSLLAIREALWSATATLPADFAATSWDTLLLDALDLLPQVGPTLVLAFSAVETRLESALNILAPVAGVNESAWRWIMERDKKYELTPSVKEQADVLLRWLSGKSLKDEPRLWEGFENLRKARNRFVHDGSATIGGEPVSPERAGQLLALAGDVIDWIEALLPEDKRRPHHEGGGVVQFLKLVTAPVAQDTDRGNESN